MGCSLSIGSNLRQGTCAGKTYSFSDLPALVEPTIISDGFVFEEVAIFPPPTILFGGASSATFEEEPVWGDPFSCGSETCLSTARPTLAIVRLPLCSLSSFAELTLVDKMEGAVLLLPDAVLSSKRPSESP